MLTNESIQNIRTLPINGKIATQNLNLLEPYQWRTLNEQNKFVVKNIDPDSLNAEMIAIEWHSGDHIKGKIFNPLVPILDGGNDIMNMYRRK